MQCQSIASTATGYSSAIHDSGRNSLQKQTSSSRAKKMNFIYGTGENSDLSGEKNKVVRNRNTSLFAEGFMIPAEPTQRTQRKLFRERHFSIS